MYIILQKLQNEEKQDMLYLGKKGKVIQKNTFPLYFKIKKQGFKTQFFAKKCTKKLKDCNKELINNNTTAFAIIKVIIQ